MAGALEHINILDLTRLLPGPFCTMLLADLGADVIKIEEPFDRPGPMGRDVLTPSGLLPEEEAIVAAYNNLARNKRSLAVDLKDPDGVEIFMALARAADVVIEGFRPGVVKSLGIDYESLTGINPRLVYCSLSGYGQTGPYRDMPGHDLNFISLGGIGAFAGDADGNPVYPGVQIADLSGGMYAALGIMAALAARERTGRGQFVDISMHDAVVSWLTYHAAPFFRMGKTAVPERGHHEWEAFFETSDGKYLSVRLGAEPRYWSNFCRVVGREELAESMDSIRVDSPRRDKIIEDLRRIFKSRTRDEWSKLFQEAKAFVTPVYDFDEVFRDPQVIAREMVLELNHPLAGTVRQLGNPIKLSDTPPQVHSFAPLHGEHTADILGSLGYSAAQVKGLAERGVVKIR